MTYDHREKKKSATLKLSTTVNKIDKNKKCVLTTKSVYYTDFGPYGNDSITKFLSAVHP